MRQPFRYRWGVYGQSATSCSPRPSAEVVIVVAVACDSAVGRMSMLRDAHLPRCAYFVELLEVLDAPRAAGAREGVA